MRRYVLKPPVPVRALVIAAIATVLGAVIIVLTAALSWPGVVIFLGVLILVLGVIMLAFAFYTPHRMTLTITTDPDGYAISSMHHRAQGRWAEVVRAVQSDTGGRISLELRNGHEEHILAPGHSNRQIMDQVADDIKGRLA